VNKGQHFVQNTVAMFVNIKSTSFIIEKYIKQSPLLKSQSLHKLSTRHHKRHIT